MARKAKPTAASSSVEPPSDLAKAMGGGNPVPRWKRLLDEAKRDEKEERLKYTGGLTGQDLDD